MPGQALQHSTVRCTKMAESIYLSFRLCTWVGQSKHKFNHLHQVASVSVLSWKPVRAHWHLPANTTAPSVSGDNDDMFQSPAASLVLSQLDHCNATLPGIPQYLLRRLQLVFSSSRYEHVTPLLRQLHWLKAAELTDFKLTVLVYKCLLTWSSTLVPC